jgi:hypothetical protein
MKRRKKKEIQDGLSSSIIGVSLLSNRIMFEGEIIINKKGKKDENGAKNSGVIQLRCIIIQVRH